MGELKRTAPNSDFIVLCSVFHISMRIFFCSICLRIFSRKPILYCNISVFFFEK